MHIMQNLIKFHQFVHKILSGNKILTITKGHNCFVCHNPKLDLVKINAYAKTGSQYTELKQNSDNNQGP